VHTVPSGYDFDRAAVEALKKWRFDPALQDGKPITGSYAATVYVRPTEPAPVAFWIRPNRQQLRPSRGPETVLQLPQGWARTPSQFSDFRIQLDYRALDPDSEGGLLVRATFDRGDLLSYRRVNFTDKTGQWQTLTVTAQDTRIAVALNGVQISVVEDAFNRVGHIGLERRRGRIEVRNVGVVRLDTYLDPINSGDAARCTGPGDKAGVTHPVPIEQPKPSYSEQAMRNLIQGAVWLEAVVKTDGTVGQVRLVKSLDLDLDQQAAGVVRRWRFKPAMKDGQAVPCIVEFEMTFTLK
jgi:TonB family protein